jgi:hypothetical protein
MTIHIAQRVIDGMKGGGRIDPYRGYIGQREPGQDRARRAQKLFEPHPSPAAEFPSSIKTYPSAQATECGSALHPLFRDGCREAVVASGREGFEECVQRRQYWSVEPWSHSSNSASGAQHPSCCGGELHHLQERLRTFVFTADLS